MKRFFLKFVSIKFWLAVYLSFLLWKELEKTKADPMIVATLISSILLLFGIREYSKTNYIKNNIVKNNNNLPYGPGD